MMNRLYPVPGQKPQEKMMVMWSDGKPTTVIRSKETGSPEQVVLPFQYTVPLSKYHTLSTVAQRGRGARGNAQGPKKPKRVLPQLVTLQQLAPREVVNPDAVCTCPGRHGNQERVPSYHGQQERISGLYGNDQDGTSNHGNHGRVNDQTNDTKDTQANGIHGNGCEDIVARNSNGIASTQNPVHNPNDSEFSRLEKEYNALKSKEQEEQVELRRLRTENRLLRQRIDNLEKETGTLADRLIQDQVKYAQQAEEIFILRRDLSVSRQHSQVVTNQLEAAKDRSDTQSSTASADSSDDRSSKDETIEELQKELTDVRHQAAESNSTMNELKNKISQLENQNQQLTTEPTSEMQHLQEELIASKLREAESNLSLKELQQKVFDLEKHWKRYNERQQLQTPPKVTKEKAHQMAEDLMAVRLKEAEAFAELKETKLKMMELETENHICTRQIKRLEDENERLKEKIDEGERREKDCQTSVKDLERKISDMESKRKEDTMMMKIRDAEYAQTIAEMRQRIAELEIENQELVTEGQLQERGDKQELVNKIADLQEEVLQLKMARRLQSLSSLALNNINLDSESEYDTDEVETNRLHLNHDDDSVSPIDPSKRPARRPRVLRETDSSDEAGSCGDSTENSTKHKVVRRKRKSTGDRKSKERLSLDFDKTPTQDSVNGTFFTHENGNGQFAMSASFSEYGGAQDISTLTNGAISNSLNVRAPRVRTKCEDDVEGDNL